jgi:ATP-dependent helicase/DNAse subunit B
MGLKLVTGPANSGRAGEVLGAYRARVGDDPILVVPGFRDVAQLQRELARTGAGLGARVVRFDDLFREIGERCGAPVARVASDVQRELLVEEAVRAVEPRALRASAARPGFTRAAIRLVEELERSMVEPAAFERALDAWRPRGARGSRLREAAAIYAAYRDRLDRAGMADPELAAWRAVDALREAPHRFGHTPVFAYGFDSFTPLELDALEALAERAEVDVTVSLPYERGRAAFKAVAPLFERLAALAGGDVVELPPVDEHYATESRAALHHLERGLFEADADAARPDPGAAVRLLAAGGERAEVELVAARVLDLLRDGTPAGEVAVVYRDPARYASVVEQVFDAYGIPYSLDRYVPLGHTALGRGLLALLRCAGAAGVAEDVFAYMRTPGLLEKPAVADRVEAEARQKGTRTVAQARELWRARRWNLDAIDRLRRARSAVELLDVLAHELDALFAPAYRRSAPVFADHELDDPRVWTEAHKAIAGLRDLAAADTSLALDAARVHDKLAGLRVRLGERFRPDRVHVADPGDIRARRFQAVFVCGLQEGEFPRGQPSEPFLSDDDRRALAAEGYLRLPERDDELERERHLFYVACSRAERVLALSARFSDEEGNPQVGSFLLEEVKDLFAPALVERTERRTLADVAWPLRDAPTAAEWDRALARGGPRHEPRRPDGLHNDEVLERIGGRRLSAGALEAFADCPVKWLVDRILRPADLEPDPEPLVRGSYAHSVLEATYRRLGGPVTPATLAEAERILLEELREQQEGFPISPRETRLRTAVRRLEFDLLRHLRREAEAGGEFAPSALEVGFGGGDDELPPLRIGPDGVEVSGRIDRVDTHGGRAVVRDYKTGKTTFPVAKWDDKNRLQVALYMLAVRELMELEPVAGLYVSLGNGEKPRGLVREDAAAELGGGVAGNDTKDAHEFEDQLERARARVGELAQRMRAGEVRPCPETCAWNGGCSYPSICREEGRR